MNIQPNNSYNISYGHSTPKNASSSWGRFKARIKQRIVDTIPQITFKDDKNTLDKYQKIDKTISKPAENRLIMGATALLTQPAIDYYNHRVDEDTRKVSRNRTLAKIIAGTSVGIVVRGSCFKLVEKMTNPEGGSKYSKALIPDNYIGKFKKFPALLNNHRSALSTGIAILAMCFTNFLIDAPLTVYLTNKFNSKTSYLKKETEAKHG